MKKQLIILALLFGAVSMNAQQVATLYFLENAPMRHVLNPAFQPVSDGYINFTPLGYTSLWVGNNSLTLSDLVYNNNGKTISAMHPYGDSQKLLDQYRKVTLSDMDITMDLLSFGFRHKEKGYVHVGVRERTMLGFATPKDLYQFLFGGGMTNPTGDNNFDLTKLSMDAAFYTELSGGYSYQINDQWTVGGKLKVLMGQLYLNVYHSSLGIDASAERWNMYGDGRVRFAAPIDMNDLPTTTNISTLVNGIELSDQAITDLIRPAGYGGAVDLGFTYKPHKQVQITAAINDLGFMYWSNSIPYTSSLDTTFTGVGEFEYKKYQVDGKFSTDSLMSDVFKGLGNIVDNARAKVGEMGFARMLNAQFNVGVDANFCNNILGIGVLSKTRMFNNRFYEEVTLGGAVRPCNWFNLAVSYSLVNNGKFSNIGAGLSLMPYDGINLTLAADYIPTSYAAYDGTYCIPYKTKGINLTFGFSIVWGTNKKKDTDKDGVPDKWDLCPSTPENVVVDAVGCPVDTDQDGVPDYLDMCPDTPEPARSTVDSVGCPIDSDQDGVPDYIDMCITLPEARAFVDSLGCDKDTDGDGVPDYLDQCITLPEAVMFVDSMGCDKDTDGDGVPDYRDSCMTLPEAVAFVDPYGCDKDTDGDGVPDYLDECPTVHGLVENKGCPAIQKEVRNMLKKAMKGIQFETGKDVITKSSYNMLDLLAQIFIENPTYIIEVQGHSDNVGKAEKNLQLSQLRAEAVMKYLVNAGVPQERITAKGYGDERPIADNATKDGRAQNRRVEFDITFEQVTYETHLEHAEE